MKMVFNGGGGGGWGAEGGVFKLRLGGGETPRMVIDTGGDRCNCVCQCLTAALVKGGRWHLTVAMECSCCRDG